MAAQTLTLFGIRIANAEYFYLIDELPSSNELRERLVHLLCAYCLRASKRVHRDTKSGGYWNVFPNEMECYYLQYMKHEPYLNAFFKCFTNDTSEQIIGIKRIQECTNNNNAVLVAQDWGVKRGCALKLCLLLSLFERWMAVGVVRGTNPWSKPSGPEHIDLTAD